jgi:hypothetical protein
VVSFVPALTREDRRSLALHQAIAQRLIEEPEEVLARGGAEPRGDVGAAPPGASIAW